MYLETLWSVRRPGVTAAAARHTCTCEPGGCVTTETNPRRVPTKGRVRVEVRIRVWIRVRVTVRVRVRLQARVQARVRVQARARVVVRVLIRGPRSR